MSVSTNLFLNNTVNADEIKKALENRFNTKIEVVPTHTPSYTRWLISVDGEKRDLSVFVNYCHGGFYGTLLSLDSFGTAEKILRSIGDVFGGFYQSNDCTAEWEEIQGKLQPSNGLPFFLRHAIIEHGIDIYDMTSLIDAIKTIGFEHNVKGI